MDACITSMLNVEIDISDKCSSLETSCRDSKSIVESQTASKESYTEVETTSSYNPNIKISNKVSKDILKDNVEASVHLNDNNEQKVDHLEQNLITQCLVLEENQLASNSSSKNSVQIFSNESPKTPESENKSAENVSTLAIPEITFKEPTHKEKHTIFATFLIFFRAFVLGLVYPIAIVNHETSRLPPKALLGVKIGSIFGVIMYQVILLCLFQNIMNGKRSIHRQESPSSIAKPLI